jgi:hypothetical protein
MPIIPEKLSSRNGSRSAIASQFWESAEHSPRYIDGQVWELPCEPPALNLVGASGLSRAQQLLSAQSMGAPFLPSYDASSGGLVSGSSSPPASADRSLARPNFLHHS